MAEQLITVNNLVTTVPGTYGYYLYKVGERVYNSVPIYKQLSLVGDANIYRHLPSFQVNPKSSKLISFMTSNDAKTMLFQEDLRNEQGPRLIELLPRPAYRGWVTISNIHTGIDVPDDQHNPSRYNIQTIGLFDVSASVHKYIHSLAGLSFPKGLTDEVMDLIIHLKPIPDTLIYRMRSL